MSGVLDRMVQRTRGMLPAAEPRIAVSTMPLHTPSAAPASAWLGEVDVEVESTPRAFSRRVAAVDDASPVTARPRATEDELPAPTQIRASRENVAAPSASSRLAASQQQLEAASTPIPAERERSASAPENAGKGGLHPGAKPHAEAGLQELASAMRRDQQHERHDLPSPPAQVLLSTEKAPSGRNDVEEGLAPIVHEHREISISIGSVTLQGTTQPAPRVSTPFRPRVSLDAFLERRQGSR